MQTLLGDGEDRREAQEEGGTRGEKVGAKMQQEIDVKGFKLVVTGHSLGAGAAALISLKLRDSFDSEARSSGGCACAACSFALVQKLIAGAGPQPKPLLIAASFDGHRLLHNDCHSVSGEILDIRKACLSMQLICYLMTTSLLA